MPRKPEPEHDDDSGIQLAEPVTHEQRAELARLKYRGPTPSTSDQTAAIVRQLTVPSMKKAGSDATPAQTP